jgi:hypothetical protein
MSIAFQILFVTVACLQSKPDAILSLSFVDLSGQPVQATIDEQNSEATAGFSYQPLLRQSSVDGNIDVVIDCESTEHCCFVYAKGFAIDLLSTSFAKSRAMRVRMQPEGDLSVLVVDRNGKPVPNARVTPGQVLFRRSAWISSVPNLVPGYYESRTDASGTAKLRGAIARDLQSLRITLDDERSCTFQIPERWDRTSVLRVVWNVSFGTLVCRVLDPDGKPVADARLFANANDEAVNANAIQEPTPEFTAFLGTTGEDGCVTIPSVPATTIDVRYINPDKSIGRGEYRKDFTIKAGQTNLLEFRQKSVCNCLVSVVDVTDSESHEGIAVQFFLRDRIDNITGEARSNEDGVCEVAVQPGEWLFMINDTTLPEGYCVYYPERSTKFTVVQGDELQTAPPVYIGKGQLIQGEIVGLNMSEIRFDWISASSKEIREQWMGRVNERGEFRILVPNHIELDSVNEFQIGVSERGTLELESKKPWVLKWTPREEPKPNE